MNYTYKTKKVCAQEISFNIEGNVITDISFVGGCNGNLKAISKLVDGMSADQISKLLLGNTCGMKGTSCADQLAKAVTEAAKAS